jgi:uncharacterized protein YdaU (DUF1376 family)
MTDNSTNTKRKAPAFQFYADDFLAGTADMTAEEVGGYVRLLCHQWTKGGIPNDEDRAGRMAGLMGSPSLRYVLAKFSPCDDGMLRNERMERIRSESEAHKAKQSASGRKGAEKRWSKWLNDGDPNGDPNGVAMATPMANEWPNDSSPSPSPSPKNKSKDDPGSPWSVRFGIEMPESLRTQPCMAAIRLWLDYKTEKREGYKRIGLQAALTKWSKDFTADTFPSAVDTSIASGWSGIFPPKVQAHSPTKPDDKWRPDMDIANYM